MTNQEKSKVIASKVGIHLHTFKEHIGGFCVECEIAQVDIDYNNTEFKGNSPNPDFFTPEGQKVLFKTLKHQEQLRDSFIDWLHERYNVRDIVTASRLWVTIEADTKLAELFFEFVEGEKDARGK